MSEEENRVYFSKKDITFYGDTEKEKKLNERLFDDSLLIAQKDDEIKELNNIIKEVREYIEECIKGNYFKRYDDEVYKMCDELLEILDKENK